jgi:hypothetical protein
MERFANGHLSGTDRSRNYCFCPQRSTGGVDAIREASERKENVKILKANLIRSGYRPIAPQTA